MWAAAWAGPGSLPKPQMGASDRPEIFSRGARFKAAPDEKIALAQALHRLPA